jgi:ubiquinone/menaquinone biosynthesis C-methylase UbiE
MSERGDEEPRSRGSDPEYLRNEQYPNGSNLNARIQLHKRFSTNRYGWHRWVFDQLDLPPRAEILEVGCGPGTLWIENLERIPGHWSILLSDFSPGMVEEAQQSLQQSQGRFRFEVLDVQAIPYPNASFDAVIANHMLYHVPKRERALSEIHRVLRPTGRLYASTCGLSDMKELHDLVREADPEMPPHDSRWAGAFHLETGQKELEQWFAGVVLRRYEDGLVVADADALVAYVRSSRCKSALVDDSLCRFARSVEQEIARHGALRITKDAGLFESRK